MKQLSLNILKEAVKLKKVRLYFEDGFSTIVEFVSNYVPYQEELIARHGMIVDFKFLKEDKNDDQ